MEEYSKLKESLAELVKSKGSLSAEELVDWARKSGIGELTLYVLVQELLETGDFRGEGGPQVIEPTLNIEVPSRLVYTKAAAAPAKPAVTPRPAASRKTTRKARRPAASAGLLHFLRSEQQAEQVAREEERGETGVGEEVENAKSEVELQSAEARGAAQQAETSVRLEQPKVSSGLLAELESLMSDSDFSKAVKYLGRYWSVGRLRFLSDMLNEGVDLKKAEKIILELRRRNLVELSEDGVINAKEELREFYKRIRGSTSIYDLFAS